MTVIAFAAPVEVPEITSRAPPEVLMTLAVTPGLFAAELMAEAMPASVLSRRIDGDRGGRATDRDGQGAGADARSAARR